MDSALAIVLVGFALVGVALWRVRAQNANEAKRWDYSDALDTFRHVSDLVDKLAPAVDQLVHLGELDPAQRRARVIEEVAHILPDVDRKLVGLLVDWWCAVEQPKLKHELTELGGTYPAKPTKAK
jgi:hypothetical protein